MVKSGENGSPLGRSDDLGLESPSSDSNGNHKRKQHSAGAEAKTPNKSRKSNQNNQDSNSARGRSSQKLNKREKLFFLALRRSSLGFELAARRLELELPPETDSE
ncbi:probable elastin-binding protein EbpS [Salvia splendens]|uniref:probable elastin-binding protein EbpS n=1 Tax=Salvia splendens TaxID=180675 RepID=UPI001C25A100|nr:probable elastin-binding protein EbpS [Salvia splendens]